MGDPQNTYAIHIPPHRSHGVSYPMRQVRWADLNLRAERHTLQSGCGVGTIRIRSGKILDRGVRLQYGDGIWRRQGFSMVMVYGGFRTSGIRGVLTSGQPGENWCWTVSCRPFIDKPLSPQLAPTSGQIIPPDQRWPENNNISPCNIGW